MMKGLRSLRSRWDSFCFHCSFRSRRSAGSATENENSLFSKLCASTTFNFRAAIVAVATLALSACGGGGGGGGGGFLPEDPNAGLTSYTLELSLTDGAGNRLTSITGAQTAILSVTVREDNSNALPVEGELVSASVGFAVLAPENGSAVTDADGIAVFEITAGDVTGGDEVVVTVDAPAGTVTASLAFQIEGVVRNSFSLLLEVTNQDGDFQPPVTSVSPGILRAVLQSTDITTGEQQAVEGAVVTIAIASGSDLEVPLTGDNASRITDASGTAEWDLIAGDQTALGVRVAVVTYTTPSGGIVQASIPFEVLEGLVEPPPPLPGFAEVILEATLRNTDGNQITGISGDEPGIFDVVVLGRREGSQVLEPVPDVPVSVIAQLGRAIVNPEGGSVISGADGVAQFIISAGETAGADTLQASILGAGGQIDVFVNLNVGTGAFFSTLRLLDPDGEPSQIVGVDRPLTLEVLATNAAGAPISGALVEVATQVAALTPGNASATTNDDGIALFTLSENGTGGADSAVVSVTVDGSTIVRSINYQVVLPGLTLRLLDLAGLPSRIIRLGEPLTLEVLATNERGEPLVGALVQAATQTAAIDPENGQATTDSDGIAIFELSANSIAGADTVTVTLTVGTSTVERSINYQVALPRYELIIGVDATATTSRSANLQVQVVSLDDPPRNVDNLVVEAASQFGVAQLDSAVSITNPDGVTTFRISPGAESGGDQINITVQAGAVSLEGSIGVEVIVESLRLGGFVNGAFTDRQIGIVVDNLPTGGVTRLNLGVFTAGFQPPEESVAIRLSSGCSLDGLSGFRPVGSTGPGTSSLVVNTAVGLAEAEYVAGRCVGEDRIQALLVDQPNVTANGVVTIFQVAANYIGWVFSDPSEGPELGDRTVLALAETSGIPLGRTESARVVFELLQERPAELLSSPESPPTSQEINDYLARADRVPIPGEEVTLTLTNTLADIEICNLEGVCGTTVTATSDADGLVEIVVNSGNVPAQAFVVASFTNAASGFTIDAASNQIIVSTGLPDQDSFSLSVAPIAPSEFPSTPSDTVETIAVINASGPPQSFLIPEARTVDFISAAILTVRLADRFNNPVPDGTAALFRTEYGAIDSSCETGKVNGQRYLEGISTVVPRRGTCSVLWTAQDPRGTSTPFTGPCPAIGGYTTGPCPNVAGAGFRSTVVTYILGEEIFTDNDGDGLFDSTTDTFNVAADDLPEAFLDINEDRVFNPGVEEFLDLDGNGSYTGGSGGYNGTLCSVGNCSTELVHVRADTVLTLTGEPTDLQANLVSISGGVSDPLVTSISQAGDQHAIYIADQFNNPPGSGTNITLTTTGSCTLLTGDNFIVPPESDQSGAFTIIAAVQAMAESPTPQLIVSARSSGAPNAVEIARYDCIP